jgi:hypothetical protein
MMHANLRNMLVAAILAGASSSAYADVVTEWNVKADDIVITSPYFTVEARRCPRTKLIDARH